MSHIGLIVVSGVVKTFGEAAVFLEVLVEAAEELVE